MSWNYWWQAHLADALVDAVIHRDDRVAADRLGQLFRGIRIRNLGRWTNAYYDDMAWLGLAAERTARRTRTRPDRSPVARLLAARMHRAWSPELGGGIPWRTTDTFFNTPANGPAAILLARTGDAARAAAMTDWLHERLLLPSGLIADGFWLRADGRIDRVDSVYTYCQGVALGAELEVYRRTREAHRLDRIDALLSATAERLAPAGVIVGAGGGDGGLFGGVLARYLALVATDLPGDDARTASIRDRAGRIVTASADAAWAGRAEHDGLPVFSADWTRPAVVPDDGGDAAHFSGGAVRSSAVPERDLSVQIGATMLAEAAVAVTIGSPEHIVSSID